MIRITKNKVQELHYKTYPIIKVALVLVRYELCNILSQNGENFQILQLDKCWDETNDLVDIIENYAILT